MPLYLRKCKGVFILIKNDPMRFIILLFILFLPTLIFAQDYVPFDFENDFWRERTWSGPYSYAEYLMYYEKDTIIEGEVYKKMLASGEECIAINPIGCEIFPYPERLYGYFREEEGKLFSFNGSEEDLLYDFNQGLGDTVNHWYGMNPWFWDLDYVIISNVDSFEICGEQRRRLTLDYGIEEVYVIEGLGSHTGLRPIYPIPDVGRTNVCYQDSSMECDPCFFVSNNDIINNKPEVNIFPNPSNGILNIESNQEIKTVEIFNTVGERIMTLHQIRNSLKTLHVNDVPRGIYYINVTLKNGITTSRKTIIH